MAPAVSLILISYNSKEYIAQSLGSAISQSLADMEIIVVDNASTDGCMDVIQQMASASAKPIKIVENKVNVGLGFGRNDGMAVATGKYIAFLDDDDWLEPDAMERALAAATASASEVLQFDFFDWKKGKRRINGTVQRVRGAAPTPREIMNLAPAAWSKLYLREHLTKWNIRFNEGYAEDVDWSLRLACITERYAVLKAPLVNYRRRPNSMAHRPGEHHLEVADRYSIVWEFLDQSSANTQKWRPLIAYHCLKRLCLQYRGKTRKPLRSRMIEVFHKALLELDPELQYIRLHFPSFYRLYSWVGFSSAFVWGRKLLLRS